jgi:epoxyqueuosine reductase QueG
MEKLVLDYPKCEGASLVGIATTETLAGGPPSTEITQVMPDANSAIVFAMNLDQKLIPDFLAKRDRLTYEHNYEATNSIASGVAVKLANFLRQKGYPSVPVAANDVYREDTPRGRFDMLPPISLRYLAVAAGVGSFGFSGNVITDDNGAGIILGAVLTSARLNPTPALDQQANYCDDCKLCAASCISGMIDKREKTTVSLGGRDYSYAARNAYLRCQFVCAGFTGLHPSGKWSTWSPGRYPIPDDDQALIPVFMKSLEAYDRRPQGPGGHYHSLMASKLYNTCANCQLICAPDKQERKRRYRLLTGSGVVVQNPDGSLEAVDPHQARRRLDAMDKDRRKLYENL